MSETNPHRLAEGHRILAAAFQDLIDGANLERERLERELERFARAKSEAERLQAEAEAKLHEKPVSYAEFMTTRRFQDLGRFNSAGLRWEQWRSLAQAWEHISLPAKHWEQLWEAWSLGFRPDHYRIGCPIGILPNRKAAQ